MRTDYSIHPPHNNYVATLTIRGTKNDFVAIGLMLQKCLEDPSMRKEDLEEHKIISEILEEVDAVVNYFNDINI